MPGLTKIDDILKSSIKNLKIDQHFKVYPVWKSWEAITGPAIAKRTSPAYVTGKTLYVHVENSVWMNELEFQKKDLMRKIKALLPETDIDQIHFMLKKE